MKEIISQADLAAVFESPRVVLGLCPEWSLPAVIAERMLSSLENESALACEDKDVAIFVWKDVVHDDALEATLYRKLSECDPDRRITNAAIHGNGSVFWLLNGKVISFVANARVAGLQELNERTRELRNIESSSTPSS